MYTQSCNKIYIQHKKLHILQLSVINGCYTQHTITESHQN